MTWTSRWPHLAPLLLVVFATGCQVAATSQNVHGVRAFNEGRYQAAMQQFHQAMASDPKNGDAYYNLASTLHRMSSEKAKVAATDEEKKAVREMRLQAENLYNQCLDVSENHVECYRGLAVLLSEMEEPEKAFTLLKDWAVANPKLAEARVEVARLYEEYGDDESAKLYLQDSLKIDRYNSRAWAALGRLREKNGEIAQALDNYRRSASLNRYQPGVGERIAALNRTVSGRGYDPSSGPDTRTVDGRPRRRY